MCTKPLSYLGEKKWFLFQTWSELKLLEKRYKSLCSGDLEPDDNWRGPERRNRIRHRPSEHLAKSTFTALEISLFLHQYDKRHFTPNVLNSVQLGEDPRALHFTHSKSKELKDFRLQDDSLVPAKVWAKLTPSFVEPEFQTGGICSHSCTACCCLLTFTHMHTSMHSHTWLHQHGTNPYYRLGHYWPERKFDFDSLHF